MYWRLILLKVTKPNQFITDRRARERVRFDKLKRPTIDCRSIEHQAETCRKLVKIASKECQECQECQQAVETAKLSYLTNLGNKVNNPGTSQKSYRKIINRVMNKCRAPKIPPLLVNNLFILNCRDKARYFNDYF